LCQIPRYFANYSLIPVASWRSHDRFPELIGRTIPKLDSDIIHDHAIAELCADLAGIVLNKQIRRD